MRRGTVLTRACATAAAAAGALAVWAFTSSATGGIGGESALHLRLAERVYRIDGVGDANVYVLVGDEGLTLIDTGRPGGAEAILSCVGDLGYRPGDIRTIVLTHGDVDHTGNVAALKAATGARIAVGEGDAAALSGGPYERSAGPMRLFYALLKIILPAEPAEPDVILRDGDEISGLRVLNVPGHTAGSIALSTDDGIVFSGDALLCDGQGRTKLPPGFAAYDSDKLRESRSALDALGWVLLLPGHGEPARVRR